MERVKDIARIDIKIYKLFNNHYLYSQKSFEEKMQHLKKEIIYQFGTLENLIGPTTFYDEWVNMNSYEN